MRPLHDGSGTDGKVQLATRAAIVTHRAEFVDRPYDAARRAGGFTVPALLLHVLTGCIWGRKLPAEFIGADGGLAHGPILVTGVSRDKYIVPLFMACSVQRGKATQRTAADEEAVYRYCRFEYHRSEEHTSE